MLSILHRTCQIQVIDSTFEEVYYDSYTRCYQLLKQDETFELIPLILIFSFGDGTQNLIDLVTPDDGWEFNNSLVQDLPLQPFTEISIVYYDGFSPSTQWRIYEWNPENGKPHSWCSCFL